MEEKVIINISRPDKIQCENCVWAGNPRDCKCAEYKFKPSNVLYEGKECEKYIAIEDEGEEDE